MAPEGSPRIYLDHNASTPVAPEVVRAMEPLLRHGFGNPSSTHAFGVEAHLASGLALRAPLLVGADGKRSRLREVAGIKCIGWSYPQSGIVATVTHEHPHNGQAVQHFLPAGPFAILPLKGNRSSVAPGEIEALEVWSVGEEGGAPRPDWFTRVCQR